MCTVSLWKDYATSYSRCYMFVTSAVIVVVVEQLACLPVTQKIWVRFYLKSKAAPRAAELTLVVSGASRMARLVDSP